MVVVDNVGNSFETNPTRTKLTTAMFYDIISTGQVKCNAGFLSGSLPVNYTETYSNPTTTSQSWGGTTNGKYLNINATGGVIQQYKPALSTLSKIFNIKGSTNTGFGFTNSEYDGMYEIEISILFKNVHTTTNLMPRIQISKTTSGTETIQPQQHSLVPLTITTGKFATVSCRSILQISANDTIRFVLSGCFGTTTDVFTSVFSTTSQSTSDLVISVKYLGNFVLTTS
jgi:hypothetical protein